MRRREKGSEAVVTTSEMVPPASATTWEPPFSEEPRRRSRWLWAIPAALVALLLGVLALVPIPYYSLSPGLARQVNDLVVIDGAQVYPPDGEVLLTTVSLRHVTAFEAVAGWFDGDVEVLHEDVLFPPSIEDPTAFNLALMRSSKETALLVAFQQLGYPVAEHGEGALVIGVMPGLPAEGVFEPGDVILRVDGAAVTTSGQAVAALSGRSPGENVRFTVFSLSRDDTREEIVQLAEREGGGSVVGVNLQTYLPRFDFPFEVDIDSGTIGGPSAGLAFTLAVLDALTPGELTGGRTVAATGTIDIDGRVGPVGGVGQKTVAVKEAGATVFLVPRSEAPVARAKAGDSLRVVGVETLDDALRALTELGGNAAEIGAAPAAA